MSLRNIYHYFREKRYQSENVNMVSVRIIDAPQMLKGKNILITGGNSGIGYAIAKRCVSSGANVWILGRNKQSLEQTCLELGEMAHWIICDMEKITEKMSKEIIQLIGRLDCLVNNAGISLGGNFLRIDENIYDKVMAINLYGVLKLSAVYADYCKDEQIYGNIVNVASNSGLVGLTVPYSLSKTGVVELTKELKNSYDSIRCNAVAPDVTISNITEWSNRYMPDSNLYDNAVKRKRIFRAEEVAEIVLFLLSEKSKCLNGQIIACDNAGSLAENSIG